MIYGAFDKWPGAHSPMATWNSSAMKRDSENFLAKQKQDRAKVCKIRIADHPRFTCGVQNHIRCNTSTADCSRRG
jgi:hypothetical protein